MYATIENLAMLTKSATPGNVQLTFVHASIGKSPSGNILLPLPSQDCLRHKNLSPSMSTSPSPFLATIFGYLSPSYSFAPTQRRSNDQKYHQIHNNVHQFKELPLCLTTGLDITLVRPAYQTLLKMIKQIIKQIIKSITL